MIKHITDEGAILLAGAIVEQARTDYKQAHRKLHMLMLKRDEELAAAKTTNQHDKAIERFETYAEEHKKTVCECLKFFKSKHFSNITTDADCDVIISRLDAEIDSLKEKWNAEYRKKRRKRRASVSD